MKSIIPAISKSYRKENNVLRVNASNAFDICGCSYSGLYFPYRDFKGKLVFDPNRQEVGRLLDESGQWHQRPGMGVHAYVPSSWWLHDKLRILTLVVGEDNALALSNIGDIDRYNIQDGLDAFRTAVLGLTSVFGFHQTKGDEEARFALVPELQRALEICQPDKVVLANDRFSSLDIDLSIAAVRLKSLLPAREVAVFPYALNEPATIVDSLELMGQEFELWSANRFDNAIKVPSEMTPETLAYVMLKKQMPFIWQRWAYDLELQPRLHSFLRRTEGTFRQQVIDLLLVEPVDGWPNNMASMIPSWTKEDATTQLPDERPAVPDASGVKLSRKAEIE